MEKGATPQHCTPPRGRLSRLERKGLEIEVRKCDCAAVGSPSKDSPDVFSFGRTEWHFHLFSMRQTATPNRKLVYRYRPLNLLDLRKAKSWAFEVNNTLDQAVRVHLIGSMSNNTIGAGDVGISQSVAANTVEPIITTHWAPFLGVRLVAAANPASGEISVKGQAQVED